MSDQLISAPESTDRAHVEPLGYLASRDEVVGKDYAYAAYKETDTRTRKWHLKIKATATTGTSLDPDHPSVRSNMAKNAIAGRMFAPFGFGIEPKDDDARLVENRLWFDEELQPQKVSMHVVTRDADGAPKEEQTVEFPWPARPGLPAPVLKAPKSSTSQEIAELAYVCSYDPFVDKDYAYLAYTEKNLRTGKWLLRIIAKSTVGARLDPDHPALKSMIDKATDEGSDHAFFGHHQVPMGNDPRKVEMRLYFDADRQPTRVEIEVVTRTIWGEPAEPVLARFDWPSP
jgi:hypothetical protein